MYLKQLTTWVVALCTLVPTALAQPTPGGAATSKGNDDEGWEVKMRTMDPVLSDSITKAWQKVATAGDERGVLEQVGLSVGYGLTSSFVDILVTETFNLVKYRSKQKKAWMELITREDKYTDSISSIKGMKDFYELPSSKGALDPSNIKFNGIEICGRRDKDTVIFITCSIDTAQLDNLFLHSKFNLVVDSIVFYPYKCHLPNITANGIRIMKEVKKSRKDKKEVMGDTIIRPGGNDFSFRDRADINIGVDFTITSSWINQAVQVNRDMPLGSFHMKIPVPSVERYTYSRRLQEGKLRQIRDEEERAKFLRDSVVSVEGDCFIVPRSYMPLQQGQPMWGTGEYNVQVNISESCNFRSDGPKGKHWRKDYKRLRKMQKKSRLVGEYFTTLWQQNGQTVMKSSYKTALNKSLSYTKLVEKNSGGAAGGAAPQP